MFIMVSIRETHKNDKVCFDRWLDSLRFDANVGSKLKFAKEFLNNNLEIYTELGEVLLIPYTSIREVIYKQSPKRPKSAMKKAVMVEDIAKTTYYALKLAENQLENPIKLTEEQIKNCYDRYQNTYGQDSINR